MLEEYAELCPWISRMGRARGGDQGASVASGDGGDQSFKIISRDYDSVNTPISD